MPERGHPGEGMATDPDRDDEDLEDEDEGAQAGDAPRNVEGQPVEPRRDPNLGPPLDMPGDASPGEAGARRERAAQVREAQDERPEHYTLTRAQFDRVTELCHLVSKSFPNDREGYGFLARQVLGELGIDSPNPFVTQPPMSHRDMVAQLARISMVDDPEERKKHAGELLNQLGESPQPPAAPAVPARPDAPAPTPSLPPAGG